MKFNRSILKGKYKHDKKWKPVPLLAPGSFAKMVICHGQIEVIARLVKQMGYANAHLGYSTALWKELARQIKTRDHQRCRSCGGNKMLDVHHVVPVKHGGLNLPENLKTLCRKCHRVRHPEVRKTKYVS